MTDGGGDDTSSRTKRPYCCTRCGREIPLFDSPDGQGWADPGACQCFRGASQIEANETTLSYWDTYRAVFFRVVPGGQNEGGSDGADDGSDDEGGGSDQES